MKQETIKITDGNVQAVMTALREYYRENYKRGESDESFLLWIEQGIKD